MQARALLPTTYFQDLLYPATLSYTHSLVAQNVSQHRIRSDAKHSGDGDFIMADEETQPNATFVHCTSYEPA